MLYLICLSPRHFLKRRENRIGHRTFFALYSISIGTIPGTTYGSPKYCEEYSLFTKPGLSPEHCQCAPKPYINKNNFYFHFYFRYHGLNTANGWIYCTNNSSTTLHQCPLPSTIVSVFPTKSY